MTKKTRSVDLEILDYDTAYLDTVDGHVTDVEPAGFDGSTELAEVKLSHRPLSLSKGSLVLPSQAPGRKDLSPKQQAVMQASQGMIGGALAMSDRLSTHARQDDNALIIAHAHNVASRPKLIVAGAVAGLVALAIGLFWQLGRGEFILITILAGVVWGAVAMLILQRDRAVALHHSAAGVEHHKIDSQADVQKTAVKSWEAIMLAMIKEGEK